MFTLSFNLLSIWKLLVNLLLHVFSRDQLKIHTSLLFLPWWSTILNQEHKVFYSKIVFKLHCALSCTCKQFQGLQLCEILHRLDLSSRTDENMAVRDWFTIHHCKDVSTCDKDMLFLYLLTSEEKRFENCLIVHRFLLSYFDIGTCDLLWNGCFTPKGLVFIHWLVRRFLFNRFWGATPSKESHSLDL